MISIDEYGDLIVRVTEYFERDDGERAVLRVEEFRVRRRILVEASPVWRSMLGSSNYAEGSQDIVEFGDDPIQSTEILFRALHKAVDESTYKAPVIEIWRLVAIVKKWGMKIDFLESWYADWYDEQEIDELDERQLLFPCWRFDHAPGFAAATCALAYGNYGHITEKNPSEFGDLHLPHRIISQLNAAKGRLRTILSRMLYRPIEHLLAASCKCKAETLWGYEKALLLARVWPLEQTEKHNSMDTILERLDTFKYKVAEAACMYPCHRNYESIVADAKAHTESYFDGMCLDCMDRMKPKTGDRNDDYWRHNNFRLEDEWFVGCRIKHKQPTWYFSFMGRQEDKDYLQNKDKPKRNYDSDSDH